jgi:hypothetical protein
LRFVLVLLLLVGLLALADVGARAYSESNIEEAIRDHSDAIVAVDASIDSFPFVGRLVASGGVPHVDLHLTELAGAELADIAEVRLQVDGMHLDRGVLLDDGRVRITGVDAVRVTAVIALDRLQELARAVGADLRAVDDALELTFSGRTLAVTVAIADGLVTLTADPLPPISVPVPSVSILPCAPDGTIVRGRLELACRSDRLPALVVEAIGSVDLREELVG